MISNDKQKELDMEKYKVDTNAQIAIDKSIALMQSFALQGDNAGGDILKLEELRGKQLSDLRKTQVEYDKMKSNETNERVKADAKRYDADAKLKVAKENKGR